MVGNLETIKCIVILILGEVIMVSVSVLKGFSTEKTVLIFMGYGLVWSIFTMTRLITDKY